MAGVEPASRRFEQEPTTSLVALLFSPGWPPANRLLSRPADAGCMVPPPLIPLIGVCGRALSVSLRPPVSPPRVGEGGRDRQAVRLLRYRLRGERHSRSALFGTGSF